MRRFSYSAPRRLSLWRIWGSGRTKPFDTDSVGTASTSRSPTRGWRFRCRNRKTATRIARSLLLGLIGRMKRRRSGLRKQSRGSTTLLETKRTTTRGGCLRDRCLRNLYDGIDLHAFGRRDSLKYVFYVSPGADYQQISVSFENTDGLWIDDAGALHVGTPLGELVEEAPYIFQVVDGQEVEVTGAFALVDDDTYSFDITGEYDPTVELVIDPDLAWGSYLGGSYYDSAEDVAVDSSGNVHVTGSTSRTLGFLADGLRTMTVRPTLMSQNFPATGSTFGAPTSAETQKTMARVLPSTIAAMSLLLARPTLRTGSRAGGTPTLATDTKRRPTVLSVKLSSSGDHLWSTYIGGTAEGENGGYDYGNAITVDSQGNALVTGTTDSQGWISGGADTSHNGGNDAYVVKLSGSGSHLWSTYLGGNIRDEGHGIAVDASDNVLVTGSTRSSGWISGGNYNGNHDAFVSKLSSSGSHLWSSYLGGSDDDFGKDITTDAMATSLWLGIPDPRAGSQAVGIRA